MEWGIPSQERNGPLRRGALDETSVKVEASKPVDVVNSRDSRVRTPPTRRHSGGLLALERVSPAAQSKYHDLEADGVRSLVMRHW